MAWRRLPMIGTRPFSTLSPSLESTAGSTVTEPSTATATTSMVPTAIEVKTALPAISMPAMAISTVTPEIEHGLARGRGGELERGLVGAPGVALLHLAPEVEHRVVDADREPDEQDHARRGVRHRDDLADRGDQADRADHGGDAEQQRDAGGHQGAEGDQEDEQRDREREGLGALEVLLEGLVERLAGAGVAELLDAQVGMSLLRGGGGGLGGVDVVDRGLVVAGHLERHERGAPVLGDLALVALGEGDSTSVTCFAAPSRFVDVGDRGLERRVGGLGGAVAGLDEDLL